MRILIVGAGYVGLCTGVMLSESHDVTLIEIDERKVRRINSGISPIYEKGIEHLLQERVEQENLKAQLPNAEVGPVDMVLICVGTPASSDGSVNLDQVSSAVDFILSRVDELIREHMIIVMKSTVPPGTTRKYVKNRVKHTEFQDKIGVVFNPEFLREGSALEDAKNPDRTVIGCSNSDEFERVKAMYTPVLAEDSQVFIQTNLESAELCKYVSNSFLATKISFANEMANIAEKIPGADIDEVMKCVGLDNRISPKFFRAGAGYGGSCFPKDTAGLRSLANTLDVDTPIIDAANEVNSERPEKLVRMLRSELDLLSGKDIAVLGLAFKPGTDDTRYSPAIKVIDILVEHGAYVRVHDPLSSKIQEKINLPKEVQITDNLEETMREVNGAILVTDWPIYEDLGLERIVESMKNRVFVDGRRVFANSEIPRGVRYITVGTGCSE